jgi:hypothetical protein
MAAAQPHARRRGDDLPRTDIVETYNAVAGAALGRLLSAPCRVPVGLLARAVVA